MWSGRREREGEGGEPARSLVGMHAADGSGARACANHTSTAIKGEGGGREQDEEEEEQDEDQEEEQEDDEKKGVHDLNLINEMLMKQI